MLEKIQPSKYKLSLIYECPHCSSEYEFYDSELTKQSFRWYCGCGKEFLIEKINSIVLGLNYNNFSKPQIIPESNFISEAIRYAFAMGYNKDLITEIVDKLDTTQYTKKEDLIRAILGKVDDNGTA